MGLYDNALAAERERVANEAVERTRGRGGVYLAAKGGERMKQGFRGLMGIDDPVVTEAKTKAAAKEKLDSILAKFTNMKTRADYLGAVNELYANGFPTEAAQIAAMIKDLPKLPEKTDKTKQFEYMSELPTDQQAAYQDFVNPGQVPNTYAEYIRTDSTPTGEEYLAYMGSNDVTQTKEWRNYSNTTDTPTKEGFAKWIDRNQSMQKFGSAKEARITSLMNDPAFLIKPEEERARLLNAIESEYKQIETFTQNNVVYNADTKEAMLPGSKETIPTVTVGGKILDARDMTVLNSDGVKREMVKRDDKQWYYVDNGSRVFANDVTVTDPETKAATVYKELGIPTNEAEKVTLASRLIQDGLAGTKIFSDIMASVDKDSANAIQRENLIVKSIERLGDSYVKSGVGEMDTILQPVEKLISEYMTKTEAADGTVSYTGSIPGWATVKRFERLAPGTVGYEARFFAENASTLINTVLKQRSGQAVTDPEWQRLQNEYSTGWTTSAGFASWVERIREFTNKTQQNVIGGFQPIVVNRYFANQGQYVTLSDPDNQEQRNSIPINGFYMDKEGNIRQRKQ